MPFNKNPSQVEKEQPWKAHWPPVVNKVSCEGVEYGVQKGEMIVVDGTSVTIAPPRKMDEGIGESIADRTEDFHADSTA
jgi:riboflavin synthase alpha subunit